MTSMHGLHLMADLRGCPADRPEMTRPEILKAACLAAVGAAGLRAVGTVFHPFEAAPPPNAAPFSGTGPAGAEPAGITGVVLLAESHLAVHTWPELGAVTLDTYVCNVGTDNSARAHALMTSLIALFAPRQVERHTVERGRVAGPAS